MNVLIGYERSLLYKDSIKLGYNHIDFSHDVVRILQVMPQNKLIFYDTEFTAWEGSAERSWSDEGEHREVIQLSAIKTTESFEVLETFDCYIKPSVNPLLSSYIKALTKIEQECIDEADCFTYVFEQFSEFSHNFEIPIIAHGHDAEVLLENCTLNRIAIPSINAYDIRPFFVNELGVDTSAGKLHKHFDVCSLQLCEHNALDDVRSLILTLKKISHERENLLHMINQYLSISYASQSANFSL